MVQKTFRSMNRREKIATAGATTAMVLTPVTNAIAAPVQTLCEGDCVLTVDGETIDIDLDGNAVDDVRAKLNFTGYTSGTQLELERLEQSLNIWAREAVCFGTIAGTDCRGWDATVQKIVTGYFYIPPLSPGEGRAHPIERKTSASFATRTRSDYTSWATVESKIYHTACASGESTVSSYLCWHECRMNYVVVDCEVQTEILSEGQTLASELEFNHNGTNQAWVWAKRSGGAITIVGWGYDDESGTRNDMPDPPTSVEFADLEIALNDGQNTLTWKTATEIDVAGFNILRSESSEGPFVQINTRLIPAIGATDRGESYQFEDTASLDEKTYVYRIEEIDNQGQGTYHGVSPRVSNSIANTVVGKTTHSTSMGEREEK